MDTLIELAKELGFEIQNDERFVKLELARQASDDDKNLQDLIGEFNLKRIALSNEMAKEDDQDKEKVQKLDDEVRQVYTVLMQNQNMRAYQQAKQELDQAVNAIINIVSMSAQGQDPDSYDEAGCSGSCSSCAGCN